MRVLLISLFIGMAYGCGSSTDKPHISTTSERTTETTTTTPTTTTPTTTTPHPGPALEECTQPIHPGSCGKERVRYGYDMETHTCVKFIYGGCGGNDNRFNSMEECEDICYRSNYKHVIKK
ncbi:uncharacterized protein LOC142984595 [Anticarsia gemmatalis]|uniref:uncharacterized protein LOC142984595 n=1 Tax=Anticarsia gemmatalis TaxID=129554 RepID=UPI003F759C47